MKTVKVLSTTTTSEILEFSISDEEYKKIEADVRFETGGRYFSEQVAYSVACSADSQCIGVLPHDSDTTYSLWSD